MQLENCRPTKHCDHMSFIIQHDITLSHAAGTGIALFRFCSASVDYQHHCTVEINNHWDGYGMIHLQ